MANASVTYREVRFILEDDLTQVYVLCEAGGDCPLGVQGWHHKRYPPTTPLVELVPVIFNDDDPVLWPQAAPP